MDKDSDGIQKNALARLRAIKSEHVLMAIEEVKKNGYETIDGALKARLPPKNNRNKSKKYDLIHEGIPYPQKYIASLATKYESGKQLIPDQFSASKSLPILKSLGFVIQKKKPENDNATNKRSKITGELIGDLYYFAKEIHENRISREDALTSLQVVPATAGAYFDDFRQMRKGEIYQRTMNAEGTEYFLKHIYADYGATGLKHALQSLDAHLHYYDGLGKGTQRAIRVLWEKYTSMLGDSETISQDIEEIVSDTTVDATTRQALIEARIGQGKFRRDVMLQWQRKCAITGCSTEAVLRASHIKPWRVCSNDERIDPENGLLLVANVDALFDRGLISFADDGQLLLSSSLSNDEIELLGLRDRKLSKKLTPRIKIYLAYHREEFSFQPLT